MDTLSPVEAKGANGHARLLVVDDDAEMRAFLVELLTAEGYAVEEAPNAAQALIRLRSETYAAIVMDKNLPGLSGLDVLPGVRTICPQTQVILITAFGDVGTYVDAIEKGAFAYIFKPFRMEELLQALHRALCLSTQSAPSVIAPGVAS